MRMTPLEIQSHQFARRLGGFDRDEVDSFLQMVTEDYEALVIENAEHRERARRLEENLDASRSQEVLLRETLTTAQSMSERMRYVTEKECEASRIEAEQKATEIVRRAEREVARLEEDIRELRGLRTRAAQSLRSALGHHLRWVEQIEHGDQEDPRRPEIESPPTSRAHPSPRTGINGLSAASSRRPFSVRE